MSLEIAYKVARAEVIAEILADETEIDASDIIYKADEIKAELESLQSIKGTLTASINNIKKDYDSLEKMESNIKDSLIELKQSLET